MTKSFAFDTNVLIYSVDRANLDKHRIAKHIVAMASRSAIDIPMQCMTEFYRAVTRKRILTPLAAEDVVRRTTAVNRLIAPTTGDVLEAMTTHQSHGVAFFDALLLATVIRAGCTTLFSEDFQHGRGFGPLTVRNPFVLSPDELNALLA